MLQLLTFKCCRVEIGRSHLAQHRYASGIVMHLSVMHKDSRRVTVKVLNATLSYSTSRCYETCSYYPW